MISFVIPAHDEEQHIGQTVSAIRSAAHEISEPFEIIVVDDVSTDATSSIAEANGARVIHVNNRHPTADGDHLGAQLRDYSCWEILQIAGRWFFRGPNAFQKREGLEIWYGPRTSDH